MLHTRRSTFTHGHDRHQRGPAHSDSDLRNLHGLGVLDTLIELANADFTASSTKTRDPCVDLWVKLLALSLGRDDVLAVHVQLLS